ncbi:S24/S26 family peptidase [Porifericola rhodea]|uniref:S24/S26 family peptidase n=1 Tax=Porifericola rhodea TaxID=930972 RepID=UPI0026660D0B|nr:S24/S26 family peptidase [Porifericola rhodea]WKN31544.1 S24/S26 family peptidase [Porifericola rhodea]
MPDNQYKNLVNERFFECINMLKKSKQVHSDREFATSIDVSPSNLGDIKANRRSVTLEILNRAFQRFGINSAYVITGKGKPFHAQSVSGEKDEDRATEVIVVATQDTEGNTTVPLINHKAAANYLTGYESQEWFEAQESIQLPTYMLKDGLCYAVQVSGDSMEPTLSEDDWVICRLLDKSDYRYINDGAVYVVVSEERGIQVKRVKNRLQQYGSIRCLSDNPKHEPYELQEGQIMQLWRVEWHLRSHLPEVNYELDDIQGKITSMAEEMRKLQQKLGSV